MMMDADSDLSMAVTTDDVKSKKLQVLQQADKDNIDSLSKKLLATRQELEDLKQKFGALKRNYDAIT
jgi:predicted transcriptional regulator